MNQEQQLIDILEKAPFRKEIFKAVSELELPECYVAGGFIRNAVWDALYKKAEPAPVNDIDVVYFRSLSSYEIQEQELIAQIRAHRMNPVWEEEDDACATLNKKFPQFTFEVKNQARMHLWHRRTHEHEAYKSISDALSDWVETSTPIGANLKDGKIAILAPQGLDDLFAGVLRATRPEHEPRLYERAKMKGWVSRWPQLRFESWKR